MVFYLVVIFLDFGGVFMIQSVLGSFAINEHISTSTIIATSISEMKKEKLTPEVLSKNTDNVNISDQARASMMQQMIAASASTKTSVQEENNDAESDKKMIKDESNNSKRNSSSNDSQENEDEDDEYDLSSLTEDEIKDYLDDGKITQEQAHKEIVKRNFDKKIVESNNSNSNVSFNSEKGHIIDIIA